MSPSQSVRNDSAQPDSSHRVDPAIQIPNATCACHCTLDASKGQSKIQNQDALSSSSSDEYEEQAGLYDFAEELRNEEPPVEPWFLEGSRLRRIYILWLNKQLALCRKDILERQQPSDRDMEQLGKILHLQGKI